MTTNTLQATAPELAIYGALRRQGLAPGRDFIFQSRQAGKQIGELDFYVPARGLGINIQGIYLTEISNQQIQKALAENSGINLIYIEEHDALSDPDFYTREALNGIDHSQTR